MGELCGDGKDTGCFEFINVCILYILLVNYEKIVPFSNTIAKPRTVFRELHFSPLP